MAVTLLQAAARIPVGVYQVLLVQDFRSVYAPCFQAPPPLHSAAARRPAAIHIPPPPRSPTSSIQLFPIIPLTFYECYRVARSSIDQLFHARIRSQRAHRERARGAHLGGNARERGHFCDRLIGRICQALVGLSYAIIAFDMLNARARCLLLNSHAAGGACLVSARTLRAPCSSCTSCKGTAWAPSPSPRFTIQPLTYELYSCTAALPALMPPSGCFAGRVVPRLQGSNLERELRRQRRRA
jgi:hypothetical protein